MGVINDKLHLVEGAKAPFLLYESGSVCQSSNQKWGTKIEFICQTDTDGGPKIIEDTNCTLNIHFATKLVCGQQVTEKNNKKLKKLWNDSFVVCEQYNNYSYFLIIPLDSM